MNDKANDLISRRKLLATGGIATGMLLGGVSLPAAAQRVYYPRGDMILGDPNAPVEVIEYASMTCSDCRRFHEEVYPALTEEWVFSGKVRFVLREYPLDRYALQASMLARCSGEQNFFGVVDVLFERQPSWSKIANPTAALRQIGMQFGVSGQAFDACMADESLVDMILSSRLEGHQRMRVTSTPTLFVNGQMVSNPMDYSEISGRIRSALQR